ncbi:MAG: PKD domain-containing protein, partial [Thermoplasmata archaeon]|nr:PKD domain-containing protein [Thermoplasmata archaeon]
MRPRVGRRLRPDSLVVSVAIVGILLLTSIGAAAPVDRRATLSQPSRIAPQGVPRTMGIVDQSPRASPTVAAPGLSTSGLSVGSGWSALRYASSSNFAPSTRSDSAVVGDSTDSYLLLFGGRSWDRGGGLHQFNDTWAFAGTEWVRLHPTVSPSPRFGAGIADDQRDGCVLLFGGEYIEPGSHAVRFFNDTWEFQQGSWTNVSRTAGPPPRAFAAMAFTRIDNEVSLFGGRGPGSVDLNDTWSFAGGNWAGLGEIGVPSPRAGMAMAYDPHGQHLVLFGGEARGTVINETWTLAAYRWTLIHPTSSPPPTADPGFTFDPVRSALVLVGGTNGSFPRNQTWTLLGGTWSLLPSPSSPRGGAPEGFSLDPGLGFDTWVGGSSGANRSSAWELLPTGWFNLTSVAPGPGPTDGAVFVYDAVSGESVLFGGEAATLRGVPRALTWIFDGSTRAWNVSLNPSSPSPRIGGAGVFDPISGSVVVFGGRGPSGDLNDTWAYHQRTWSRIATPIAPTARAFASLAYDPTDGSIVLFGGRNDTGPAVGCLGDTWRLRSGNWTELPHQQYPPNCRESAILGYDPGSSSIVLFGGDVNGLVLNDTWVLSYGNWTQLTPLHTPSTAGTFEGFPDPHLVGIGVVASAPLGAPLATTAWVYIGGDWHNGAPTHGPEAAPGAMYAFEDNGQQVLCFGGVGYSNGTLVSLNWTYSLDIYTLTASATPARGPAPLDVNFVAVQSGGDGQPWWGGWEFGDGASQAAKNTSHQYMHLGRLTARISWMDPIGTATSVNLSIIVDVNYTLALSSVIAPNPSEVGVPTMFNASPLGPSHPPYAYNWSFGDGATASGPRVSHYFRQYGTYLVSANLRDGNQVGAWANVSVRVADRSQVVASATPDVTEATVPIVFTASTTGGVAPFAFLWAFGDASFDSSPAPRHSYASAGTYIVTLISTDALGVRANATLSVTLGSGPGSAVTHFPPAADVGVPVRFTVTPYSGLPPYTIDWSFGDGTQAFASRVTHSYVDPGLFNVTVAVQDSAGGITTRSDPVRISARPSLSLLASPSSPGLNSEVRLTASVVGGTAPFHLSWEFDNGTSAYGYNVTASFSSPGKHPVIVMLV